MLNNSDNLDMILSKVFIFPTSNFILLVNFGGKMTFYCPTTTLARRCVLSSPFQITMKDSVIESLRVEMMSKIIKPNH